MRAGKTDFKGEFWVGQRVRVDFTKVMPGVTQATIACNTGVIRSIHGKFLRTPDLAVVTYSVWFDAKVMKRPLCRNFVEQRFEGESLERL
jgi:hypothetical protein